MSAQHTQGRLKVEGTRLYIEGPGIDCVATMQVSNQPLWDEDARRLAACWNACEMVSTEDLEALTRPGDVSWAATIDRVVRERDALLAALEVARDHIDMDTLEISHCKDAAMIRTAIAIAIAIAKAEGGAG